jgi:two-component system, OmpR family, sensor kinase
VSGPSRWRSLRRIPLRIKLVAAVLGLVAMALAVISVGSTLALKSYMVGRIDTQLHDIVQQAHDGTLPVRPADDTLALPSDSLIGVSVSGGWKISTSSLLVRSDLPKLPTIDEAQSRAASGKPYTVRASDGWPRWRVLVAPWLSGQFLLVAQGMTNVDNALTRLIWIDALVGIAVLVLLASVGAAVVRASLRPLVQIEQTAGAIAAGDLTRRVPDPEPGGAEPRTELGRLSRALNAMLTQIEAAFTARAASETAARAAESAARDAAVAAQVSEARARRSEERMRQFVADASHELRTPLTTIRGFAELHRQGAAGSPEEAAKLVRRIEDEAARMGLLVEDLLLLARLDQERPLDQTPVELRVIAMDAVQAAQAVAPQRRIELEIAEGAGPLVVLGDDARLRQVVGNLMTNAITHTPPDASVTLRLRSEPGNTTGRVSGAAGIGVIEVSDTGPGLAPDQLERVFERFYRADVARTRRADGTTGTGLGLAIVAALVAAHQGTVQVESEPGRGTTFRVRLPLAPP